MVAIPRWLADVAGALGLDGVHEPLLGFADSGRLELAPLIRALRPVTASSLSHGVRTTMRTYLYPRRPEVPSLIVDGTTLGAEVPLEMGAWCVVEAGAMTIHVPHGLPNVVGVAAVGRRLGDVVSIGVEPLDYVIDRSGIGLSDAGRPPQFDTFRAPVPILRM